MAIRFFILLVVLNISTGFSQVQDSISLQNNALKDSLLVENTQIKDTLLDIRQSDVKTIAVDSFSIDNLKDHELAAKFDAKWRDELYHSNNLYDTISKSVAELDYKPVIFTELPTDTLKARLKELNARTPFNVEYNPALESVIKSYLKNRPKTLQRLINLSAFYFPMFETELDKHNIPLEIKYLAVVESALKPRAKSRVGATGLWQFMYTTGKNYGLHVSSYVDERSDPIMSTEAAAKYLSRLYDIFDDWDLALAAYNSGPGNVNKAIRRSGGYKNYWNIRHNLPRETAGYLPAFLANMYIFEYAEAHGFTKPNPEIAYFQTDTVKVKHMITLDHVSKVTGTPIEELKFLNPSYKLDIIPYVKNEDYVLRLPIEVVGKFVNNEVEVYHYAKTEFNKREKPLPQYSKASSKITYRVKSGDYLGKIARRYSVRISDIKRWNGLRSNNIDIGQRLSIYPKHPQGASSASSTKTNIKDITGKTLLYTVKNGDSLWSISQKFSGVSVQNIIDWNGISGSKLKPGMKLKISKG
ncbi:LysM peptidoglycan-binding domain-containing protein [Tamlana agarivorans]|uniref:LysM peptidoglycan-binding domain-containing protein n=1 Tax=Pseudotamlana agarivorans TaxID=481183 RepID=A0ACC5U5S3_9FLAO|nr:lytic transglycosylase domain-containing protein [Tamlana agarivorans]MBU2949640.1 LysM peptidoglycan-binding domain-containing protein [Tamlana agarivorans]